MARHEGGCHTPDIFVKYRLFLRGFDFTTVFQDGRQPGNLGFRLVNILFLFQILISYIN